MGPKTKQEIEIERQLIDDEYEKAVDQNGNSEDLGEWRIKAHEELDEQ